MNIINRRKRKQGGFARKLHGLSSVKKRAQETRIGHDPIRNGTKDAFLEDKIPFRTLIELAPIAISISREGIGLYANLKLLQLIGLQSLDEFIGRPTYEFIAPERQEAGIEVIRRRGLGLPVPKEYETVGLRADGSQLHRVDHGPSRRSAGEQLCAE